MSGRFVKFYKLSLNALHGNPLANPFYGRDVISIKDFQKSDLKQLFATADKIVNMDVDERRSLATSKTVGMMFYEPSTRTRLSFASAMYMIGGNVLGFSEPDESSVAKGENLADTVRTVENFCDALILRHSMEGAARFAAEVASKPIINGGSGTEEHPTQAMLDLYTILKEKGKIKGLNITILGDLKYGRTVYSLLYGLSKFDPQTIFLISPPELKARREALLDLEGKMTIEEGDKLDEVISNTDVLYVTRIQKERFPDLHEYEKVTGSYVIDNTYFSRGKEGMIILHPLPRVGEIKPEVDLASGAKYFTQVHWGKIIRAALLALILSPSPP